MQKIKNIVFDLGDVLLNLDYNKTIRSFKDVGYTDFEKMYTQFKGNKVFDNLETGLISEPLFYEYMLEAGNGLVTKQQVTDSWNAMLLDFRVGSLAFLKEITQTHRIYLLSNTNAIHKIAFEETLRKQTGARSLDEYFHKTYYSHMVGLRKPNEDIFRYVLQDAGIIAAETLFVDDLAANVETADRLGFRTHQLLKGERIENLDYNN